MILTTSLPHERHVKSKTKTRMDFPESISGVKACTNIGDTNLLISDNLGVGARLDDDQKELARKCKLKCYAFFCYTTKMWDKYNEEELGIRKGRKILTGGLQLATNTMPQGDLIPIPLNRNIGYQHTTHIVIHLDQAEPDLGRKSFQPEIEQLAKDISAHIVTSFSELKWWEAFKKSNRSSTGYWTGF